MRNETRKWHLGCLAAHTKSLFNTLLYENHITSSVLVEIDLDEDGMIETSQGYFAKKDRKRYWVEKNIFSKMPIKLGNSIRVMKYKDEIVHVPVSPIPFKITPDKVWEHVEWFNEFIPFNNTEMGQWQLMKILGIAGYCCRTYTCIASKPELGKSCIQKILHGLTDKVPVFKPRSVPGVLNKINGTGNMVFDDVLEAKKDVREIMEEFSIRLADGSSQYHNGAMKSAQTKNDYDTQLQSITYLYNTRECYIGDVYFDSMFHNNEAIDSRFLKLVLEGELTESFSKDFDIPKTAEDNKMFYINQAKQLLYIQQLRLNNAYTRRFKVNSNLELKGRRRMTYDEITWVIDLVSESQKQVDMLVKVLDDSIIKYREMMNHTTEPIFKEERI